MQNIINKNFYLMIGLIFLLEIFSFFGYLLPEFRQISFIFLALLALIIAIKDLKYGIYLVFLELLISSKGYLFYFEHAGMTISIRIALWLIIMSVWAGSATKNIFDKKYLAELKKAFNFRKNNFLIYLMVFFVFLAWGLVNGFLKENNFSNIFFDFNAWLYFLLIFPIWHLAYQGKIKAKRIAGIFLASISWMAIKTFFLLFIFSHNITSITEYIYSWVRITGVGEITNIESGFYRIFFQSHIFALLGFFIFFILLTNEKIKKNKDFFIYFYFLFLSSFMILASYSRSFWVGMLVGLIGIAAFIIRFYNWKIFLKNLLILLLIAVFTFLFVAALLKFPYPNPTGGFSSADLLSKRVTITNEAAVSSRWALLTPLWQEIKKAPILGKGFGTLVSYKSSDPRVLEKTATGEYSTYAFEWGWLDIWLKLGILGLFSYLILILKTAFSGFKIAWKGPLDQRSEIFLALLIGLFAISVTSFFSPYLNHPLGIGFLILTIVSVFQNKNIFHDN